MMAGVTRYCGDVARCCGAAVLRRYDCEVRAVTSVCLAREYAACNSSHHIPLPHRPHNLIAGESAGGLSVCMLSVSPLAKGLFKRSIAESAACTGPWGPGVTEWGLNVSAQVLESVGVSSIAEARDVSAAAFQWPSYYGASNPGYGNVPWLTSEAPGTWIDGYVLTKPPIDYYVAGELNINEFMIGGNSQDGITPYYEYIAPVPQTDAAYPTSMATHWGDYADAVVAQYPLKDGEGTDATAAATQFVKADGEYNCNCAIAGPETSWAALLLNAGATVYHYCESGSRVPSAVRRPPSVAGTFARPCVHVSTPIFLALLGRPAAQTSPTDHPKWTSRC
jgi:hypothetical protein